MPTTSTTPTTTMVWHFTILGNTLSQSAWAIIRLSKPRTVRHRVHNQIFQALSLFFCTGRRLSTRLYLSTLRCYPYIILKVRLGSCCQYPFHNLEMTPYTGPHQGRDTILQWELSNRASWPSTLVYECNLVYKEPNHVKYYIKFSILWAYVYS